MMNFIRRNGWSNSACGSAWCRCVGPVYNKLVRRSLVEEHSLRFVVGLKEGEDLAFLLMLLPFAPRLRTLSDRFYHYRRERPGSATYGRDLLLGDFRMDLLGMDRVARFWQRHGLLDSPAVFGLVDYYMEFIRRHFIMKEGAFFKASPEDRETLLSGWKKWLELVGGEKALSRLDRWDPGVLPPSAGLSPPGQFLFFPACPPDVIPQRTPGGLLYPEKALGEVRGKTLLPSVFWCGMRP